MYTEINTKGDFLMEANIQVVTDEELIKTTTQKIKRFEEMKKINV